MNIDQWVERELDKREEAGLRRKVDDPATLAQIADLIRPYVGTMDDETGG